MELNAWKDPQRFAQLWQLAGTVPPVMPMDNNRIANLMSAEGLSYEEAKARVIRG